MTQVNAVVAPRAILLPLMFAPKVVFAELRVDDPHRPGRPPHDLVAGENPLRTSPRIRVELHSAEELIRRSRQPPRAASAIVRKRLLHRTGGPGRRPHVVLEEQRPVGPRRVPFNRGVSSFGAGALPRSGQTRAFQADRPVAPGGAGR